MIIRMIVDEMRDSQVVLAGTLGLNETFRPGLSLSIRDKIYGVRRIVCLSSKEQKQMCQFIPCTKQQ